MAAGNDVSNSEEADHITCLNWKTSFNLSEVFSSKADQEEIGESLKMYQQHRYSMHEGRKKNRDAMEKKLKNKLKKLEEAAAKQKHF